MTDGLAGFAASVPATTQDLDTPATDPTQAFSLIPVASIDPLPDRGANLRIVLSPRNAGTTAGILVVADIAPGQTIREHFHPYSEEKVLVLEGRMLVTLDGEAHEVDADHAFVIPIGVRHRMTCLGTGAVRAVLCLGPLAPRPEWGHVDT